MIVNPDKFQAMILQNSRNSKNYEHIKFESESAKIETKNTVKTVKSQKQSIEIKRLRNLALEIFKTINDLNPSFMKSIFSAKLNARVRPNDILVKTRISAIY